jgi:ubiquinone/menaquinone biosynthesis C-methylase UbiE
MNKEEWWEMRSKEFSTKRERSPESKIIEEIVEELKPIKILEVGSNFGRELKLFEGKYQLYGVDSNLTMVKNSRKFVKGNFFQGVSTNLPFKDNEIDFVYTCGLLSHLDNEEYHKSLKELFRVSSKYVLLNEYLGTQTSKNSLENVKQFTWVRDYSNIISLNSSLKFITQKKCGTDLFQTLLFEKKQNLPQIVQKIEKEKRFVLKLGKLKLEIE